MDTPCVEFAGYITPYGYGQHRHKGKNQQAHRVAYCEHHGIPIEDIADVVIRHKCDNRACINWEHLEPGTQADNIRDMDERGRRVAVTLKGVANGHASLTQEQVAEIRANYVRYSKTHGALAFSKRFGVDRTTILCAARGVTYKDTE